MSRFRPLVDTALCEFPGVSRVFNGKPHLSDHRALVETDDLHHVVDADDGGVERNRGFLV